MAREKVPLDIAVEEGDNRAGKGEIVKHYSKREGVKTDETGKDYRAITYGLENERVIEFGMAREDIDRSLARVSFATLVGLAKKRDEIIETSGDGALYTPEVTNTVGHVAPHPLVRDAVKAGFKDRIRQVRDSDDYNLLVVDGRHLRPVIEEVEDVQILLRSFVTVHPTEAALRECIRLGIDPESSEGREVLAGVIHRRKLDAERDNDPVKPEDETLNYSHDPFLRERALGRLAERMFGGDELAAYDALATTLVWPVPNQVRRDEIGREAVLSDKQVYVDTTAFRGYQKPDEPDSDEPRTEMLNAFDDMLDGALETSSSKVGTRR